MAKRTTQNRMAAFTVLLVDGFRYHSLDVNHEVRVVTLTTEQGLPDNWQELIIDRSFDDKQAMVPLLNLIFKYGQNDFQPAPVRSVSAGDIIVLKARGQSSKVSFYQVAPVGFTWMHDIHF